MPNKGKREKREFDRSFIRKPTQPKAPKADTSASIRAYVQEYLSYTVTDSNGKAHSMRNGTIYVNIDKTKFIPEGYFSYSDGLGMKGSVRKKIGMKKATTKYSNYDYLDIEIGPQYDNKIAFHNKNEDKYISPNAHTYYQDTSAYSHLHPDIVGKYHEIYFDDSKKTKLLGVVKDRISVVEGGLYKSDLSRYYNDTYLVFDKFIELQEQIALASETHKKPQDVIKELNQEIDTMLYHSGVVHNQRHEELLGMALVARNIMCVTSPIINESTGIIDKNAGGFNRDYTAFIDYDFLHYRELYSELNVVFRDPPDINYIVSDTLCYILMKARSVLNRYDINVSDLRIINFTEWTKDFLRYMREIHDFKNRPSQFDGIDIKKPVPIRLVVQYRLSELSYDYYRFLRNQMPIEIINLRLRNEPEFREKFVNDLWKESQSLIPIRQLSYRHEFAPQLWDTGFAYSFLTNRFDGFNFIKSKHGHKITTSPLNAIQSLRNYFANCMIGGQATPSSWPLISRKSRYGEDLAEQSWFVAFMYEYLEIAPTDISDIPF